RRRSRIGIQGMINDMVEKADFPTMDLNLPEGKDVYQSLEDKDITTIARLISLAENREEDFLKIFDFDKVKDKNAPVLGITGTGGAGKSSMVDELVRRFLIDFPKKTIALISVDPSKKKTGGALLGDRIRMNSINNPRVYMRSLAT